MLCARLMQFISLRRLKTRLFSLFRVTRDLVQLAQNSDLDCTLFFPLLLMYRTNLTYSDDVKAVSLAATCDKLH